MYKLYTDKVENFEAVIKLEGASPSNSKARLVVESETFSLLLLESFFEIYGIYLPYFWDL